MREIGNFQFFIAFKNPLSTIATTPIKILLRSFE